LLRNM